MNLRGVIAAIVTPLDGKGGPDAGALRDLAFWHVSRPHGKLPVHADEEISCLFRT